jgi:hypothetical protein
MPGGTTRRAAKPLHAVASNKRAANTASGKECLAHEHRKRTKTDVKELATHSKARTPMIKISKPTKRTVGSLRQKARFSEFDSGINGKREVENGSS